MEMPRTEEHQRLEEARTKQVPWRKWGPYLSERQWGTVREDYSEGGTAWDYFTHDQARSRAYRWGEDGLAGLSDEDQQLCFALTLWNGVDPILKERLFGLSNSEGNHGEDVKEYYFYLDSTPTHSYMKWLYKYPQQAYPYDELVRTNKKRSAAEPEYELLDTKVFDDDRYFDVTVEYAKETPEEILIRITATNCGAQPATLHLLPTLWFRNTWDGRPDAKRPVLRKLTGNGGTAVLRASHPVLGERFLTAEGCRELLFTENETNTERLFDRPNRTPYVKDAFHAYLVEKRLQAVNPDAVGTKAAALYRVEIPPGASQVFRLRLGPGRPGERTFDDFDATFDRRLDEADAFYQSILPSSATEDQARVSRQAFSGMLWSKQYYLFEADVWLKEHGSGPWRGSPKRVRNDQWGHMLNADVISMPDKWEYPWYAAWDLAFHSVVFSEIDVDFAKAQLELLMREVYLHPNGQIPAYEWNFGDVNPPVQAWATLFLYNIEQIRNGRTDPDFLKRCFSRLLLNFTWWVNRKDRDGSNVFEGGFLGLDNIGVFDRSAPLPTGGYLEQADGTAWMAVFSQNMFEIAAELAYDDSTYEPLVGKFAEHFLWIAAALNRVGEGGMWDEEDGFYYDVLRTPDGHATRLKVRSLVGLLPLCATTILPPNYRERLPRMMKTLAERLRRSPELGEAIHPTGEGHLGFGQRGIAALVNPDRLRRILSRMLDEQEFLGPHGIRSVSRFHAEHPYVLQTHGQEFRVSYLPAESDSGVFGGNSNWRGPVWFPINVLLIRGLLQFYLYYGDTFRVECPTGSGKQMNLFQVAKELADRMQRIFLRDAKGRRPVFGDAQKFQTDPRWKDNLLFYEYFHGDNGAGIGASHQTGWTGLVATLIDLFGHVDAQQYLEARFNPKFARRD
jgi:hypothetical protein